MKYFTTAHDVSDIQSLIDEALMLKKKSFVFRETGKQLTLGLVFMNPSLRTRLSTQKAAQLLGMNVLVINGATDGWMLESGDLPMNGTTVEHIREAAAVMGEYCDLLAVRSFPTLTDKRKDESEEVLLQWMNYSNKPLISLESATRHPLQSLADMMTIREFSGKRKPKVILTWAPHVKPVPHAVANSFCEWMPFMDAEFVIACPAEAELNPEFTSGATVTNNQEDALQDADFVYVKSWSSWKDYGKLIEGKNDWMLTPEKLKSANNAKVMHCLPVRRDVELPASVLESNSSIVIAQAANRVYAAQAVLKKMAETNFAAQTRNSNAYDHSH
jgi:N-succinyl-L-ornithine transcarbamylase